MKLLAFVGEFVFINLLIGLGVMFCVYWVSFANDVDFQWRMWFAISMFFGWPMGFLYAVHAYFHPS